MCLIVRAHTCTFLCACAFVPARVRVPVLRACMFLHNTYRFRIETEKVGRVPAFWNQFMIKACVQVKVWAFFHGKEKQIVMTIDIFFRGVAAR